jgi:hypothetical protein
MSENDKKIVVEWLPYQMWNSKPYKYEFQELDYKIKSILEALPRWCRGENGDFESHEWVNAYSDPTFLVDFEGNILEIYSNLRAPTKRLKYSICKHCGKRSNETS